MTNDKITDPVEAARYEKSAKEFYIDALESGAEIAEPRVVVRTETGAKVLAWLPVDEEDLTASFPSRLDQRTTRSASTRVRCSASLPRPARSAGLSILSGHSMGATRCRQMKRSPWHLWLLKARSDVLQIPYVSPTYCAPH
jgi:hypothetical protein